MAINNGGLGQLESQSSSEQVTESWQLVQGFEHWKQPGLTLRISFQYIPYSYGTAAYVNLQQLSLNNGWNVLKSEQFMSRGAQVMPTEEAVQKLKDYAAFLFADGLPAS